MNVGSLVHLVTIQTPGGTVSDGDGGSTQAWITLTPDEWASITPATARDQQRKLAGAITAVATHVIRLHYRDDITIHCRVLHSRYGHVTTDAQGNPTTADARVFNVAGQQNVDEDDTEWLLDCTEVLT